jgi:hypothetical protein
LRDIRRSQIPAFIEVLDEKRLKADVADMFTMKILASIVVGK